MNQVAKAWEFVLARRANMVFLALLIPLSLAAFVYHRSLVQEDMERANRRFEFEVQTRHQRMLERIARKKKLLRFSRALIASVSRLGAEHLQVFNTHELLEPGAHTEVCWTASDGKDSFSSRGVAGACAGFDLLEPSRIYGAPPRIVLSIFAPTEDGRSGYASVSFDAAFLALEHPAEPFTDFLIVSDSSQAVTQAYRLEGDRFVPHDGHVWNEDVRLEDLMRFGDVGFVYAASRERPGSAMARHVLLAALLSLALLTAVLVRHLNVRNQTVHDEVKLRTDELSQFAYRTSHDLRAPLVSIQGLCDVVQEDLEDGELDEVGQNIGRIRRSVERLDRLVSDILALSRADLSVEEAQSVNLPALVAEVAERVNETLPQHPVAIRIGEVFASPVRVPQARISQILENLISNSVKYANPERDDPQVNISVDHHAGKLMLEVDDNGLGIPEQFQGRLFQMFQRFHPHVTNLGSGLGMSIVKKHVDQLGGSVHVTSSPDGTRIQVMIPARAEG